MKSVAEIVESLKGRGYKIEPSWDVSPNIVFVDGIKNHNMESKVREFVGTQKSEHESNICEVLEKGDRETDYHYSFIVARSSHDILKDLLKISSWAGFGYAPAVWEPNPKGRNKRGLVRARRDEAITFAKSVITSDLNFKFMEIVRERISIRFYKPYPLDLGEKTWELNKKLYNPDYDEIYEDNDYLTRERFIRRYQRTGLLDLGSLPSR